MWRVGVSPVYLAGFFKERASLDHGIEWDLASALVSSLLSRTFLLFMILVWANERTNEKGGKGGQEKWEVKT